MRLLLRDELPFVTVTVGYRGAAIDIPNVLVDTGSAGTLINADLAESIGIVPEPGDRLRTLRGVGGREVVFTRRVDRIAIGPDGLDGFEVEVGGMDYGFDIGGILGTDFLVAAHAILDLRDLEITLHV